MKTLNLTNNETSDIKFEVSKFPDGQQQVAIKLGPLDKATIEHKDLPILIKARINNWSNLERVTCTVASLRKQGVTEIHLQVPYLLGARSDRYFGEKDMFSSNNYVKDVIAPAINNLNLASIIVLDPHSDVLEACLDNFQKESNNALVKYAIGDLYNGTSRVNPFVLISPDAGALKKIYSVADCMAYKGEYIICSKFRDHEGKLSRVEVPIRNNQLDKDFIIIDDICDGGKTFIEVAKKIKETTDEYKGMPGKIYLIVTHGIFSQGFEELGKYFDRVYCTNSYRDISDEEWMNTNKRLFIKQFNVFY